MGTIIYGDNLGNIGGSNNIVINYIDSKWALFGSDENSNNKLNETHKNLLYLELFNLYGERIIDDVNKGLESGFNPIKINMTEIIDCCTRGLYYNGVRDSEQVYDLINLLMNSLLRFYGINFSVTPVRVADYIFYELAY